MAEFRNLARSGRAAIAGLLIASALALAGMTCTPADQPQPTPPAVAKSHSDGTPSPSLDDEPRQTTPVVSAAELKAKPTAIVTSSAATPPAVAAVGLAAMSGRAKTLEETARANRKRFIALSVGPNHNCAIHEDGRALCWGWDSDGRLAVPGDERFVAISAGEYHTCGLRADGAALCWGSWEHQGPAATSMLADRFVAISSGRNHACGLRENGSALCWGGVSPEPWPLTSDRFSAIFSLDSSSSCGIRADGASRCWPESGAESARWIEARGLASLSRGGRCGLKISGEVTCPAPKHGVLIHRPLSGEHLRFLGGSWDRHYRSFICGIRPDSSAACFPVAPRSDQDWNIPKVPSTRKFLDIGAGEDHACGLLADGSIKCWGSNHRGEGSPPPTQPGPPPAPPSDAICNPGVVIVKGSGCKLPEFTDTVMRRFAVTADGLGVVYGEADEIYETRYVSIDITFVGIPVRTDDQWFELRFPEYARCEGAGTVEDLLLRTWPPSAAETPDSKVIVAPAPQPPDTRCTVLSARADANGNWIIDKTLVWERERRN